MIEALAMQGAPSVSNLLEHAGPVEFQTKRLQSEVFAEPRALAFAEVPDTLALTCWLLRDAMIKRLDADIDSESDDKAALTHEARQKAEAEVMGDLLGVEREEASLTWRAIDEKLHIEARADISALALLGVALVSTPRAIDGPSTTPLAFDIVQPGR